MRSYLATVIIPTYGREKMVERAVESVINQNLSELVEIIVVDDCYDKPLSIKNLREQDVIIRSDINVGGAGARNIGLNNAKGEWLFLLDSDDYYINVDFTDLYRLDKNVFYFSNIKGKTFPHTIDVESYFKCVLVDYISLAQTSSLFFHRNLGVRFESDLPKHQDWDLVYFQVLQAGIPVRKHPFLVYQDKSDKQSLSRKTNFEASKPFYMKLKKNDISEDTLKIFSFIFFYPNKNEVTWLKFISVGSALFCKRHIDMYTFLKVMYKRLFLN